MFSEAIFGSRILVQKGKGNRKVKRPNGAKQLDPSSFTFFLLFPFSLSKPLIQMQPKSLILRNALSTVFFTTQMTINKFLLVIMRVPQNKIFENARQTIHCKKNVKGYFRTNMNLSLRSNIDNRSEFW